MKLIVDRQEWLRGEGIVERNGTLYRQIRTTAPKCMGKPAYHLVPLLDGLPGTPRQTRDRITHQLEVERAKRY